MAWKRMRNPGQVVFIGSASKPVISFTIEARILARSVPRNGEATAPLQAHVVVGNDQSLCGAHSKGIG